MPLTDHIPNAGFEIAITPDGKGRAIMTIGSVVLEIDQWRETAGVIRGHAVAGQGEAWRWVVLATLHGWDPNK